jgi:UDPglucose--hexose-1-phosphate uridylyltransferase
MVRKRAVALADGRALFYFGDLPEQPSDYPDRRPLPAVDVWSEARWDRLRGEWVVVASHRQQRTFQPSHDQCPLCPSRDGRSTEIPAPEYDVVVFENRFPTLRGQHASDLPAGDCSPGLQGPVLFSRPAGGRCEVVCFSQRHDASFADLNPAQAAIVMAAWADRSAELAACPASSRSTVSRIAARTSG